MSDSFLDQAYKDKLNVPEALSRLFDKRTPSNATVVFLSDNNISLSSHKMRITSLDVHSKEERECTLRTQFVAKRYKEKEGVGILQNMWQ